MAQDDNLYRIVRIWGFPDRPVHEPAYEIETLAVLTPDEFANIYRCYQRIRQSNHPVMVQVISDIIADYKLQNGMLTAVANAAPPSRARANLAARQGRIAVFAVANAAYSLQEYATAIANRIGGSAPTNVKSTFATAYNDHWRYLFAYQMRRVFSHVSFDAFESVVRSRADGLGDKSVTALEAVIKRSAVTDGLGPRLRKVLSEQDRDPSVTEVFDEVLRGVAQAQSGIKAILYPEREADLAFLGQWSRHFMTEPANSIAIIPANPHVASSTFTAIEPHELRIAGMRET